MTISAVRRSQYPTDNKPEFLLVGRSNVGKSSFINTLINRKNFARTSANPGKTQTINFYLVNDAFYLVDAPGYGFANLGKNKIVRILDINTNKKQIFMLACNYYDKFLDINDEFDCSDNSINVKNKCYQKKKDFKRDSYNVNAALKRTIR